MERKHDMLQEILGTFEPPVLIVSTIVGKGIYSIGEAIRERMDRNKTVYHIPIEEMLPQNALNEDMVRYKFISNKLPFLLYLVYTIPLIYKRKLLREKYLNVTSLKTIKDKIDALGIKTVICASHRPAFWLSMLKNRENMHFTLWGLLSEYGRNLGWKYILWECMDGFLSPVERKILDFNFKKHFQYITVDLPSKSEFHTLALAKGSKNYVLLVAGHWGQMFKRKALKTLLSLLNEFKELHIFVVCGKNKKLLYSLQNYFRDNGNITLYGEVPSLATLIEKCACIITKPGISTIVEAQAAKRKIFLMKGMPVAEDNNARYAINHFNAEWFSLANFKRWYS